MEDVAKQLGISAAHLHRLFRKHLGRTPKSFPCQQSVTTTGADHALVSADNPSAEYETGHLPDPSICMENTEAFEQRREIDSPDDIGLDFGFTRDLYLLGSSAANIFNLDVKFPMVGDVNLPSMDGHWTDRLSI